MGERTRRIIDDRRYAHFVTFSCFRRRRILDDDRAKQLVVKFLGEQLNNQNGELAGFVVMPDHVHVLVRFQKAEVLSVFVGQWKRRSSTALKAFIREHLPGYAKTVNLDGPIWQPKYYSFEVFSDIKAREKLSYMHQNPVQAGLVSHETDWAFSSARWYRLGQDVGVPIQAL